MADMKKFYDDLIIINLYYFHNPDVPIFGTTWDFTNLSTSTMK